MVVVIKLACCALEASQIAIRPAGKEIARHFAVWIKADIVRNEEIEIAVVIIIKPRRARSPSFIVDTCLGRYIGESAVAFVAVEFTLAITGDLVVSVTVVVISCAAVSLTELGVFDSG